MQHWGIEHGAYVVGKRSPKRAKSQALCVGILQCPQAVSSAVLFPPVLPGSSVSLVIINRVALSLVP